jgi:hypothetical protein
MAALGLNAQRCLSWQQQHRHVCMQQAGQGCTGFSMWVVQVTAMCIVHEACCSWPLDYCSMLMPVGPCAHDAETLALLLLLLVVVLTA